MQKRGQATLFIVAGVFLMIVFGLLTIVSSDVRELLLGWSKERYVTYDYNEGLVRNTIASCISDLSAAAILQLAVHGGYLSVSPLPDLGESGAPSSLPYPPDAVPVLLDTSGFYTLSEQEMGSRICNYVYAYLGGCLDVASLEDEGFAVSQPVFDGDWSLVGRSCQTSFRGNSVVVKVDYPVLLSKDNYAFNTSNYAVDVRLGFKGVFEASKTVLRDVFRDSVNNSYDLSDSCASLGGLRLALAWLSDDEGVVSIVDPASADAGYDTLAFRFGINGYNLTGSCN
ncbi:hypothetical protein JW826_04860 [Candidatus Woesearchaeota archaeon]|nr:hypothetical protein [Candidatus Woesearchaeota archaeon]